MRTYTLEKAIHNFIRTDETAARIETAYDRGLITTEEAFRLLAERYKEALQENEKVYVCI